MSQCESVSACSSRFMPTSAAKVSLSCDQVALILRAIRRIAGDDGLPAISRHNEMRCLATLYEIMEIVDMKFEDKESVENATPRDLIGPIGPKGGV